MSSLIELLCANKKCGKKFSKDKTKYNHLKAWGRKDFYCSPKCVANRMRAFSY